MTDEQRNRYFGHYWPAACQAKRWRVKDEVRRRHTTGECMRLIGAPITESTTELGEAEITALFCYLDHLANPSSLEKSQRWVDCQQDYKAFNEARQADWFERKTYGRNGSKRLRRDRFKGQETAQGEPQEVFDPAAIRKRLVTMGRRARAKGYRPKKQAAGSLSFVAVIGGKVMVGGADFASGPDKAVTVQVDNSGRPVSPPENLDENCPF